MTWHAQAGKLVLTGDEADLFREAILLMCDVIVEADDDEESFFEGATVFDNMSRSQQLASLETVARHLFHKTAECLPLTAWSEATLASVLHEVKSLVRREAEEGERDEFRRAVVDAMDVDGDAAGFEPDEDWTLLLDAYEDRFLWDLDFEDDDQTDLPPEHASRTRQVLGIGDDYYASIPPDLRADETVEYGAKRVWMAMDGKKTFRLRASLTCELPASLALETIEALGEEITVLHRALPQLELMSVDPQGNLSEASAELHEFFFDRGLVEYAIEETPNPPPD